MAKSGVKKTRQKIKSKIEAIKKINDNPVSVVDNTYDLMKDDISSASDFILRKKDDFTNKTKAKKTEISNVLTDVLNTVEGFLDTSKNSNSKDKPLVQKKLIRYSKESAAETLKSAKQIILDAVQNKLFAGDNVCGINNDMPLNSIEISPKEFDFLDMLKISPETNMGHIMYESDLEKGFIKMNKEFYYRFDKPYEEYFFTSNSGDNLFSMIWEPTIQKFIVTGLTGNTGIRVSDFIKDYYSTIEQIDSETMLKQAMLMTIQGDDTAPESFYIKMDWLNRLLDKLFSICNQKKKDKNLNQNNTNLIDDDEIDLEWYFDFESTEGIDLDDEDSRHRKVLKFKDCDNFEIPVDSTHIEDFVYFSNKENIENLITTTINSIATEAYEDSNQRFSINDLEISLSFKYVLNVAKAIVAGIISPKYFFPIITVYKSLKGLNLTAAEFMKRMKNMFFYIIKNVFWKFIQELWNHIKRDLLKFLEDIAVTITLKKFKRYKLILTSLISLLTTLLKTGFQSCDDIFEAILSLIESALSSPAKVPIPAILLALSDQLPGYSSDRAYMNTVERLTNAGIDMEPIYGAENKTHSLVKSIIDGNSEEIDENSYIKISLKQTIIPSGPGGAVITPMVSGVGKLF